MVKPSGTLVLSLRLSTLAAVFVWAGCAGQAPLFSELYRSSVYSQPVTRVGGPNPFGSASDEHDFQRLPEGSEILPIKLARALISERTGRPFFEQPERFGMIAGQSPGALPIGLTSGPNAYPELQFLGPASGFNCAACHSAEIRYQGKVMLVEGAPSRTDFSGFSLDLTRSAEATLRSPKKLLKFISDLNHQRADHLSRDVLVKTQNESALAQHVADRGLEPSLTSYAVRTSRQGVNAAPAQPDGRIKEAAESSRPEDASAASMVTAVRALGVVHDKSRGLGTAKDTPSYFDFGRVDAFGSARRGMFPPNLPTPPNAPVSYPPIWDFARESWLHYDGNTRSVLARNVGQAIGLKARYNPETFESSVNLRNIHRLETVARKIAPPRWPENFLPRIDRALAAQGRATYQQECAKCHDQLQPNGDAQMFTAEELGVSSDRVVQFAGPLQKGPFGGQAYSSALQTALGRVMEDGRRRQNIGAGEWREIVGDRPNVWRTTKKYAAKPLRGVWATSPYLHNGSVPDLEALLSPVSQRPGKFYTDNRTYDPQRVGYSTDPASNQSVAFSVSGSENSNRGHLYGTTLPPAQHAALLEYLKTL